MVITPYIQAFYDNTIREGGATVDLTKHSLPEPDGRYYVGYGPVTWVHRVQVEDFTPAFLSALVLIAKREARRSLGTWVKNDVVIIEPTAVLLSLGVARALGKAYGQEAIFDSETRETIYV